MSRIASEAAADGSGEKEIASRTVQIQSKRFYLDVKQNRRGRFLKIAEVGAAGQKSRILMSMSSTAEFRDKLVRMAKHIAEAATGGNGSSAGEASAKGDHSSTAAAAFRAKSETLVKENRRYFLDLKENQRGRYLRIVQQVAPSGLRSQVALPAEGVGELGDRLTELIDECGTEDSADGVEQLPESRSLRVDNKTFYFDVGYNRRGTYLRISEVRAPNFRAAVTVPENFWPQLRDILTDYIDKVQSAATAIAGSVTAGGKSGGDGPDDDSSGDDVDNGTTDEEDDEEGDK